MPKPVRISVIGAGSATFSLGLVKDLCLTENLSGSHITFMDIDADRLDAVTTMAARFTAEIGSDLSFEQTTGLRRRIAGSAIRFYPSINSSSAISTHSSTAMRITSAPIPTTTAAARCANTAAQPGTASSPIPPSAKALVLQANERATWKLPLLFPSRRRGSCL